MSAIGGEVELAFTTHLRHSSLYLALPRPDIQPHDASASGFASRTSAARPSHTRLLDDPIGALQDGPRDGEPSAFAAFRLITNSNVVGCSTGISAGLAPLRILSTRDAERRNRSASG